MTIHEFRPAEALEARRLLSSSFASVNSRGVLSVVGGSKNDSITIVLKKTQIVATLDGQSASFDATKVKGLWIDGFGGSDKLINSTALPSTLIGSSGNDTLVGGEGDDSLEGDSGTDTADYSSRDGDWQFITPLSMGADPASGSATLCDETDHINPDVEVYNGSQGDDTFVCLEYDGPPRNTSALPAFTLHGNGGDDEFDLGDGGNSIDYGDSGNDNFSISDDGGTEKCYGGSGDDVLSPVDEATLPYFDGGLDTDRVNLAGSRQPVISIANSPSVEDVINVGVSSSLQEAIGNSLNNYISGFDNQTLLATGVTLLGEGGNDTLVGANADADEIAFPSSRHNSLNGGSGNDVLIAGNEGDLLHGGSDNDTITGGLGANTIYGDSGTDTADYSGRTENLNITIDDKANDGAAGENDNVEGDIENVITGSGNDYIAGNPSNNRLEGGAGDDTIWGDSANDTLIGDTGHDQLQGQDGNDVLDGKDGHTDTLDGGDGTDKAQRDDSSTIKDQVLSIESFIKIHATLHPRGRCGQSAAA